MNNKYITKILLVTFIITLALAVIGMSYAYFELKIKQSQELTILDTGDLRLRYTDNMDLTLNDALPGDSIVKTLTVENIGDKKVSYNIVWSNLINTINDYDLQLDMKCKSYKNYNTSSQIESGNCDSFYKAVPYTETSISKDIRRNNEIDTGITHEYTVTITFKNRPYSQNDNLGKSFSGKIDIEEYIDPSPKPVYCTYDGELTQGAEYVNGQYTYRYKQEGDTYNSGLKWVNLSTDGWGVQLTDRESTKPVTTNLCTYINNKPVVSMRHTYSNSNSISIDLSGSNTSNITTFYNTFSNTKFTELDLSKFNTSKAISMSYMFQNSTATSIDLSSFDTKKVTNMSYMFDGSKVTALDLSSFDTSKVAAMSVMFNNCVATSIDISSFDISKVTSMNFMFAETKAKVIDTSNFNTSSASNILAMFYNSEAEKLYLNNFDTSNVVYMGAMFSSAKAKEIDVSSFDTSKVQEMNDMFRNAQVKTLDLSSFDTSNVIKMNYMFSGCQTLTIKGLENFNTSKVTEMIGVFANSKAKSLNLSSFDTSNVTSMERMFYNTNAIELKLNSFNTSKVTNMKSMFYGSNATIIDTSSFNTSSVTDMSYMFYDTKTKSIDVSNFNTKNTVNMEGMFSHSKATNFNLNGLDTRNVTNMKYMFSATLMEILDLSSFDTSKVTDMEGMFREPINLKTIYVGNKFSVSNVSSSNEMLYGCTKLVGGAGTKYDSTKTDKTYGRIDGGESSPGYFTLKTN